MGYRRDGIAARTTKKYVNDSCPHDVQSFVLVTCSRRSLCLPSLPAEAYMKSKVLRSRSFGFFDLIESKEVIGNKIHTPPPLLQRVMVDLKTSPRTRGRQTSNIILYTRVWGVLSIRFCTNKFCFFSLHRPFIHKHRLVFSSHPPPHTMHIRCVYIGVHQSVGDE